MPRGGLGASEPGAGMEEREGGGQVEKDQKSRRLARPSWHLI